MLAAIDFDDEPCVTAGEIGKVRPDGFLAPELPIE
jgi:hypothetical protein